MSPKTRDPEDRRMVILDTAMQLWIEKGFEGMRLDIVAKKARVSKGTLYQLADNKADLAFLIMQRRFDKQFEQVRKVLAAFDDPFDILQNVLHNMIPAVREASNNYAMEIEFFAMTIRNPKLGQRLNKYITPTIDKFKGEIERHVERGVKNGTIREDIDVQVIVDTTHAWGHLMWHEWITHAELTPVNLRERTDHFLELLFAGMRPDSA